MALAAAPRRVAKTWSVLALGLLALTDVALAFVHALTEFTVSAPMALVINSGVALFIMGLRFTAQQIAVTRDEKIELLTAIANEPMRPVETDVVVRVGNVKIN